MLKLFIDAGMANTRCRTKVLGRTCTDVDELHLIYSCKLMMTNPTDAVHQGAYSD